MNKTFFHTLYFLNEMRETDLKFNEHERTKFEKLIKYDNESLNQFFGEGEGAAGDLTASFNACSLAAKSSPVISYCEDLRGSEKECRDKMDSGETFALLQADVVVDDDCFRPKNLFIPPRCFSSGVQNVDTFELMCEYFRALETTGVGFGDFDFSSLAFDGVRKFRTSRFMLGSGSFC